MANTSARPLRWLPMLGFLAMTGCTISFGDALRGKGPNDHDPSRAPDSQAATKAASPPAASADQVSQLLQRLGAMEDERKGLAVRLQSVEAQLRDKDRAVVQATYEIQESTNQMKKAREDLYRWKADMDDLRSKLRVMDQENKVTLEAILKSLEQYVDKEALRSKP